MKVNIKPREIHTLKSVAEQHDLTLEIIERTGSFIGTSAHFYAHFDADIVDGCFLRGAFGNGRTPQEAVRNYIKEVSGKEIKTRTGKYVFIPHLEDTIEGVFNEAK